ncbi:hypothetical protein [Xylella fastidiosa]|uniref:hypothetical protein n=1 Tax=Xylella fastidiosa TaxID=2371 RepID=UPI0002DB8D50|nr:hypothetical protein [Xylella fastidiosa]
MFPALVMAAVRELSQPRDCRPCHGRGFVRVGGKQKTCTTCGGSGTLPGRRD